jgi:WD40 repeat protein
MSHPSPSLLFFHPTTLEPLRPSLADLAPSSRLSIPTFALSGRLLAYTTSDPPRHTGKDGLGTLITSSSVSSRPPQNRQQTPPKTVINSAVGIGGGVARGVWAGIKMGAQAASRATNGRMATSAPTHSTLPHEEGELESRSLDDSSVLDESTTSVHPPSPLRVSGSDSSMKQGGEWIKIIDLTNLRIIAHFRLPPSRHIVPNVTTGTRRFSETGHSSVSHLTFSPDGTTLFAAPADGRSFHLFEIHPQSTSPENQSEIQGEVWHLYELRRGNTASEVVEVNWSPDGRWVGVATGRGTVREQLSLHPGELADIQMYSPSIQSEV